MTDDPRFERFAEAYLVMARTTGYRPMNVSSNLAENHPTRLRREAEAYARHRLAEDDNALFEVPACTEFGTNRETLYLLEAAELLCCGSWGEEAAVKLIKLALKGIGQ